MWTVPVSVLRIVALLLLACAATAFVMGVLGADPGGARLPGEAPETGAQATTSAAEAEPLSDEPARPAPVEQARTEDAAEEAPEAEVEPPREDPQIPTLQAPVEPAPRPAPPPPKAAPPPPQQPRGDAIGDLVDGLTPQPELPPF